MAATAIIGALPELGTRAAPVAPLNIRKHLHLTLEELSLGPKDDRAATRPFGLVNMSIFFPSLLELKSMPRLKTLNLCYNKDDYEGIQNLRQHLPHLMIKGALN